MENKNLCHANTENNSEEFTRSSTINENLFSSQNLMDHQNIFINNIENIKNMKKISICESENYCEAIEKNSLSLEEEYITNSPICEESKDIQDESIMIVDSPFESLKFQNEFSSQNVTNLQSPPDYKQHEEKNCPFRRYPSQSDEKEEFWDLYQEAIVQHHDLYFQESDHAIGISSPRPPSSQRQPFNNAGYFSSPTAVGQLHHQSLFENHNCMNPMGYHDFSIESGCISSRRDFAEEQNGQWNPVAHPWPADPLVIDEGAIAAMSRLKELREFEPTSMFDLEVTINEIFSLSDTYLDNCDVQKWTCHCVYNLAVDME